MVKSQETEKFGDVLRELREADGETQESMGILLGLSTKTISRWELGETRPDKFQVHGVMAGLGASHPAYRTRLALALGLDVPDEPPPAAGPNMTILKAALDGALFEATEKLGVPPQKVREAVALVLERVALLELDPKTAAKLVKG
ncbi:MAG: helix-turn-helix domain-containing protein [Polyangiaceae bacterium]